MADKIVKNDFVEFRFTGKVKGGEIFDTNIVDEAKKIGLDIETKPLIICVGHKMILPKLDDFLVGKDLNKDYNVDVSVNEGFGERKRELMKILPMDVFVKQNLRPIVGAVLSFDGMPAKISAVSGGRVTVDFNNPLSGKDLEYDLKATRKINDLSEKVRALIIFYFRQDLKFEIKEKVVVLDIDPKIKPFLEAFSGKFKEILDLSLDVKNSSEENSRPQNSKSQNFDVKAKGVEKNEDSDKKEEKK